MCSSKSISTCNDEITTRLGGCGHCIAMCDGNCGGQYNLPTNIVKEISNQAIKKYEKKLLSRLELLLGNEDNNELNYLVKLFNGIQVIKEEIEKGEL